MISLIQPDLGKLELKKNYNDYNTYLSPPFVLLQ